MGWFRKNSDKLQAIILNWKEDAQAAHTLIIDNKETKTTNSIKLPGINTDDQLKLNEHIVVLLHPRTPLGLGLGLRLVLSHFAS